MYRQCTTAESAERQQQLIQSLLDLMGTMDYSRITVADICSRVGVTRKTFYRYFDCKDDCLFALLDQVIRGFADYYPHASTTPRPSREFLEHYFAYWKQQRPLMDILCRNQLTAHLYERTALGIQQAYPAEESGLEFAQIVFMICGTTGMIISWHVTGYRETAEQMAAAVAQLISNT